MSEATPLLDCVVVGAGPAGLSAALWLEDLGLRYQLLERGTRPGGELDRIHLPIRNYLGVEPQVGRDFLTRVRRSLSQRRLPIAYGAEITDFDPAGRSLRCGERNFSARTVILATGLRRRRLDIAGAAELVGHGVSYSATSDFERLAGSRVAVIGGGDGALENALLLAERCPQVTVIHRRASFSARRQFVRRVYAHQRITVLTECRITALETQAARLVGIQLAAGSGSSRLELDWLVVKIGFLPNTGYVPSDASLLDEQGYLVVDRYMRTAMAGVLAAGDVCNPRTPCIAAAVGDGAVAAREVSRYLESASASL